MIPGGHINNNMGVNNYPSSLGNSNYASTAHNNPKVTMFYHHNVNHNNNNNINNMTSDAESGFFSQGEDMNTSLYYQNRGT